MSIQSVTLRLHVSMLLCKVLWPLNIRIIRISLESLVLLLCLKQLKKVVVLGPIYILKILLPKYIIIALHETLMENILLLLVTLLNLILLIFNLHFLQSNIIIFFFQLFDNLYLLSNFLALLFGQFGWIYIWVVQHAFFNWGP